MFRGVITRIAEDEKQTLGNFVLFSDTDLVFHAKTLELPWLNNAQNISCIPAGDYLCKRRHSVKYGWHWKITELNGNEVRGREWILIHKGNFHRDILGCVVFGTEHIDIDNDGYLDVTNSSKTMKRLNAVADQDVFALKIIDMTRAF